MGGGFGNTVAVFGVPLEEEHFRISLKFYVLRGIRRNSDVPIRSSC